jgi:uridine kinase
MTRQRNLVIAITGGTGAGKSSLAEALAAVLGSRATAICQDWYFLDRVESSADRRSPLNVHHPDCSDFAALSRDLAALRAGRSSVAPDYCFETKAYNPAGRTLLPRPIVIVEGELVLHDENVRALVDHSVFLDAPADLRLVRRLRREARDGGHNAASVLAQYATTVRPLYDTFIEPQRSHADMVLDASSPEALDRAGASLGAWVRSNLHGDARLRAT